MAQRPRISQLKRMDTKYRTFEEQYKNLEQGSKHQRAPVMTQGELPMTGNLNGSQCLVISEGVVYYWEDSYQNWRSALGRTYELPTKGIRRFKKSFIAEEGQTDFKIDVLFSVGNDEVDVYIQGILQDVNVDYYEIDERTIKLLSPLQAGMEVTIATPMIIQESVSLNTVQKRLEELEYNHYQLMMAQYYSGKPIDARGMVYDGFLNTSYIDYVITSMNIEYDNVLKTMRLKNEINRRIYEQFDSLENIDASSTITVALSEMTLPVSTSFTTAFLDDFSSQNFIDMDLTNAYHDLEKELITTVDTYAGGDHYEKGDFMNITPDADRVGFSNGAEFMDAAAYNVYQSNYPATYVSTVNLKNCFSVLPMGNMTVLLNDNYAVYRGPWPYTNYGYLSNAVSARNVRTDGYTRTAYVQNSKPFLAIGSLMPTDDSNNYRQHMTYVSSWNKIFALRQLAEASNRYYQRLYSAVGRNEALNWVANIVPSGLPNTLFGSPGFNYTGSKEYISQIGSTYDRLLLRVGDRLYFLDSSLVVTKTLDWSAATRKPSNYNVIANQMTADARYLYFPARLNRDGYWGYYLEVFDIKDGSFVNEILVTRDNSGTPGTTAMGFDHDNNRLVLGLKGGEYPELFGKGYSDNYLASAYAGFLAFEAPSLNEREVISKPILTNLAVFKYRLEASETLNSGEIQYYIRFNNEAWTKIKLNTDYSWSNPKGAKDTQVQLRAVLKASLDATTSPVLTDWTLKVRQYLTDAILKTKVKLLELEHVTGGKLLTSQAVPQETSLGWSIKLDVNEPEYPISEDGSFSISGDLHEGNISVQARLGTNNTLLSPVVQDFQVQLHQIAAGTLATQVFNQIDDINQASTWVTTGTSHEYYNVYVSRNGGETWVKATKDISTKQANGNVETLWKAAFDDDTDTNRRSFKLKFEIDGVTEIHQYGAMLD